MQQSASSPKPRLIIVGDNATPIWGMSSAERIRRIGAANKLAADDGSVRSAILANAAYAFDPAWVPHLLYRQGTAVTRDGIPVLAHLTDARQQDDVRRAMESEEPIGASADLEQLAAESDDGIFNEALRKREQPFAERLIPQNLRLIERLSYKGAYKGVTDVLTKYLWPEWAFVLTRLCARLGITPNQVTGIGTVLCIAATIAFWEGWFWTGLLVGLVFMVLDTVDGKLARCTITSSALGNAWDHGVDLVHPPFWWWAWAQGCGGYGHPLDNRTFALVIGAMLFGYVAQRLIEGAFIMRFGMHIHVWRRFDTRFRLVTARRNPNMVILFALLLVGRPDLGIIAVAIWTMLSLVVHLVRLAQAEIARARGATIVSWLA